LAGAGQVALVMEHSADAAEGAAHVRVVAAPCDFIDGKGAFEVLAGTGQIPLIAEHGTEAAESGRHVGMVGAQCSLLDG
jgi:hypothetical protein